MPGTGKSSLAFAVASNFGLKIYCLSLSDRTLQDKDLPGLFSNFSPPALLLLEDIDSAGLNRESQVEGRDDNFKAQKRPEDTGNSTDKQASGHVTKSSITLSGLLNAIDGVVAPTGHILIMTSNRPETLDPALVRPGRVDANVEFTLASKDQAESIFKRMYNYKGDEDEASEKALPLTADELSQLAKSFAAKVPNGLFSPADIQDYIIVRRFNPQRAVDGADEWVEAQQAATKEKTKHEAAKQDDEEEFHDVAQNVGCNIAQTTS